MEIWKISLIIGAVGILIVILISLSKGISTIDLPLPKRITKNDSCDSKKVELPPRRSAVKEVSSYKLSHLQPVDSCPSGYTFFTDLEGNSLCCGSSNINVYEHTCVAKGKEGVCALVPGIIDTRQDDNSTTYLLCHDIGVKNQLKAAGSLCPSKYKYHVNLSTSYKCCGSNVSPGAVDCNSGSKFCNGLKQNQSIFSNPASCENIVLLESIECPDNTSLIPEFKMPKWGQTEVAPICVGAKGNCIPRKILEEGQKIGKFSDIDINTNIMNCDIYDKYHNERVLNDSQIQIKISKDI